MAPSVSLRLVKFRLYLETKLCIAPGSEWAATPTKVTAGLAAATWLRPGASALQNGHHGVQNHSTARLPCKPAPLNGAPLRVVPLNSNRSSAASTRGAVLSPRTRAAAARPSANLPSESRTLICSSPLLYIVVDVGCRRPVQAAVLSRRRRAGRTLRRSRDRGCRARCRARPRRGPAGRTPAQRASDWHPSRCPASGSAE